MNPHVLYSGSQAKRIIQHLLGDPSARRIVAVAYIGRRPLDLLPAVDGLEVFCWPSPGATSADGIRDLIRAGAKVRFVDRLHSKLYWAAGKGAVLGSCNLSHFGLDSDGNQELAVYLPDGVVDIELFLRNLNARNVTEAELAELDRQGALIEAMQTSVDSGRRSSSRQSPSRGRAGFHEWLTSPMRQQWKIAGAHEIAEEAEPETVEQIKRLFDEDETSLFCDCENGKVRRGEWVLSFRWNVHETRPLLTDTDWIFAEHVARGTAADGTDQVVQVYEDEDRYPPPPFKLSREFRGALSAAIEHLGWSQSVVDFHTPTNALIRAIDKLIKEGA